MIMNNHPFILNKYTYKYFRIIDSAIIRSNTLDYYENHHIIPDCLFTNRSRKGRKGNLSGDPNSKYNVVKLTAREHFLCHWLLTKMVPVGLMYYSMELAFGKLKQTGVGQKRIWNSRQYERLRVATIIGLKGQRWYNNGIDQCLSHIEIKDWSLGMLPNKNNWFNNGVIELMSDICPDGYVLGRLYKPTEGKIWYNNGVTECMLDEPLSGYSKGRLQSKTKDKIWYNNGIEQLLCDTNPDGWVVGRIDIIGGYTKNKKLYNNGIQQIFSDTIPDGYTKGALKGTYGKSINKRWFTNGIDQTLAYDAPDGWYLGRCAGGAGGLKWYNNGIENTMAKEQPVGYILGKIKDRQSPGQ